MGPPIGREEDAQELIWQFREACDRHCGRPVFYGVPQDRLHLFWDTGLSLLKIGEEAIVDLPSFHLNGASRQGLRYKKNNLEKRLRLRGHSPGRFLGYQGRGQGHLRCVALLKNAREKRFSLGCFDPDYLARFSRAPWYGRTAGFSRSAMSGWAAGPSWPST